MKKVLKKPDEMEMEINYKAMRFSWILLSVTFLVWACVELARGNTCYLAMVLMTFQSSTFFISKAIYTLKMKKQKFQNEK